MAAAQPNSQESWAGLWLPFDLPSLENYCPEGAASPTSTDHRSAGVGCSEAGKGPAEKAWGETCWQERDLAGVTAVWRTSQYLRVTGSSI